MSSADGRATAKRQRPKPFSR